MSISILGPLQIVHVIVRLDQGGAEQSLARLVKEAPDPHTIVCFGSPTPLSDEIEASGCRIHFLPLSLPGIWRARQLLKALQADIVQGWMYYGNFLASLMSSSSCKTVWSIRSTMTPTYSIKLRSVIWLSRWMTPDLVLYNANAGRASHPFFSQRPTKVIANGIETEAYAPNKVSRSMMRDSLGWAEDEVVIAMVTRFHADKGLDEFFSMVKAFEGLASPPPRFVLVGRGMSSDNVQLQTQLAKIGLTANSLQLLGERRDMTQLYAALDVLVVASYREGTPNVLLEAMASGVTVIGTDVGDVGEIVADPARVFPPGDSAAMIRGVSFAIEHKGEFALRDRQRIVDEYDSERCRQAYTATYLQLSDTDT